MLVTLSIGGFEVLADRCKRLVHKPCLYLNDTPIKSSVLSFYDSYNTLVKGADRKIKASTLIRIREREKKKAYRKSQNMDQYTILFIYMIEGTWHQNIFRICIVSTPLVNSCLKKIILFKLKIPECWYHFRPSLQ